MPWIRFSDEQLEALKVLVETAPYSGVAGAKEASDTVTSMLEARTEGDPRYLAYAQENMQSDGDIEFDDDAVISEGGDPGAYVMCWKWVYAADAGVPLDEEED